jgi:hypothetical protein
MPNWKRLEDQARALQNQHTDKINQLQAPKALENLLADPTYPIRSMGLTPDPWQAVYLRDKYPRKAMLCCRRAGKSFVSAVDTSTHCLTIPDSLVMVFSPTLRQSIEYARYVRRFVKAMGHPVKIERQNLTVVEWANGSRMMSLPDNQEGVVGFTPTKIVIDEGSRVSDILYKSIRPMLALGKCELEVLSTPFGKQGWFFEIFNTPKRLALFHSWQITVDQCPRISREFLEEERLEIGDRWFNQEYYLAFNDTVDAVFTSDIIEAAIKRTSLPPLFGGGLSA